MIKHGGFAPLLIRQDREEKDPHEAADMALTKRVATVLETHYAGYPWRVEVSHTQGVVMLSMPIFMGHWKHVLKIQNLKSDPMLIAVRNAAGEILERFKIPRAGFSADHFKDAMIANFNPSGRRRPPD
jgi:hypothetical protein